MGNKKTILKCTVCGKCYKDVTISACETCGGILLFEYPDKILLEGQKELERERQWTSIQAFEPLLPEIEKGKWVSLNECGTPYLEGKRVKTVCDVKSIWFKDEGRNPTGSFKDRAISLCMSKALDMGCDKVIVASSGNGAASVSAYAARAGVNAIVVIPETTPEGKIIHAQTCQAQINRISGSFDKSFQVARSLAEETASMNLTTTFLSPMGVEGYKTIAYEIYAQAQTLPQYIFIPVGAGPVLYGIYKGFCELKRTGQISELPRLAAVQSEGCAPIVRAWKTQKKTTSWCNADGIASAIADPLKGYEDNGDLTVAAICDSKGFAVAVTDEEILYAGKLLASQEGLFVEPSSAAAFAGVIRAKQEGQISADMDIAVLLTGNGMKDPMKYAQTGGNEYAVDME